MKKRICCFCEKWESGGIESFLNNVLGRLDADLAEIDIVAAELEESIFTAGLQAKGVHFYELSGSQRNLSKNWSMFKQLLSQRNYDVVHVNAFQGLSLYYVHIAKQAGVPVRIAHSHNTALRQSRTKALKMAVHNLAKGMFSGCATDWWACSADAAEFLFSRKITQHGCFRFIPNGIETARFRFDPVRRDAVRRELGLAEAVVIGNVGRLCYQKNQEFVLDVFAEVEKRRPESRLLFIGSGEDESMLKARAQDLGIAGKVLFYGVSNQVEQLFWAMDVFVFPSRFEGLGIVAVEAQAAGLEVLCSEFVPREAHVTPWAQTLSLGLGAGAWADRVLACAGCGRRELAAEKVKAAGFDIADVVKEVERGYGIQ